MKLERDLDCVRDLLLRMEAGEATFCTISSATAQALMIELESEVSDEEAQKLAYHLDLLEQGELITIGFRSGGGDVHVDALTWKGHDFLDGVRDNEIWAKTKAGAKTVGGISFELLGELAKGFAKKKILDHTGIEISL